MATFTGTNTPDIANATTGTLTGFTGGSVAELQDAISDTFFGNADNDTIIAGSGDDILNGGTAPDILDGREGSDIYDFNNGDLGTGELITDTGSVGIDAIRLLGTNLNFQLPAPTISGIEALIFTLEQSVLFSASQLPASFAVTGLDGDLQELTINGASVFSAAAWTFTAWNNAEDFISINGTSAGDAIAGTSQNDSIGGGTGADILDGAGGSDTYLFFSGDSVGDTIIDSGTSGIDTIRLGPGGDVDFTAATTIAGIEAVLFTDFQRATFNADQLPGNLAVAGTNGQIQILEILLEILNATNFSAAGFTFTNWEVTDPILINGTDTADNITGSSQNDDIEGGDGDDVLTGGFGDDFLTGDPGNDTATYADSTGVTVSLAIIGAQDTLGAGVDELSEIENLTGSALGIDALTGDGFANVLSGLGGNDALVAGAGNDTIIGGSGKDTMTGEADADIFEFNLKGDSKKGANRDVITDFVRGEDEIDVSGIDAKNGNGNQKFKFIGKNDFHQKAGELHYVKKNGFVFVEGDTNGDGRPDFQIKVDDLNKITVGDFIL
jgi:serralysin